MTEDQLRYFVKIVDTGSYMETAIELNIAQSSISKQIQALESELGVQLFNRQHRHISLTNEGIQLLPLARHILDGIHRLTNMAKKLQPGYKNKITLLTLPFLAYFDMYVPMYQFESDNPFSRINIIELEEPQLFHKLKLNSFDIILTYWHEENLANRKNRFFPISEDEIVLAVHKNTPLAKLDYVTPEHLKNIPLMLMESYTCVYNICMAFFKEHDIVPDIFFRGRPETIFGGVEAKQGAALISRKQASYFSQKNVILLPILPSIPAILGAVINENSEMNTMAKELAKYLMCCEMGDFKQEKYS